MGGLIKVLPFFSGAFLIGAMSIAGFPPMGGFISKFSLFQSAVSDGFYWALLIAVGIAVVTIFYMFRTWIAVFWGENRDRLHSQTETYDSVKKHKISLLILIPIAVLCAAVILLGIFPEPLYEISNTIAIQILDPTEYIATVLEVVPR